MCGIIGYTGKRQAAEVLLEGLRNLEYRGYDSAGIALFTQSGLKTYKAQGRLSQLEALLGENLPDGQCGIGHTRWATHGVPSDINSHPHASGSVTLVHNGILENYMELREQLLRKGRTFVSQTDTEVIAQWLDEEYQRDHEPAAAIRRALPSLKGSYALGILFADRPGVLYAVRKDSPLIVGQGQGENLIASDITAILPYTRDYLLVEENELAIVTPEKVQLFSPIGEPVDREFCHADWDVTAAQKGGYAHFMRKEIDEQPRALEATISPRMASGHIDFSADGVEDAFLSDFHSIQIVACGTAMHAGMIGKYLIESLARVPVSVNIASEYRYSDPIVGKDDLVIIVSQSGETADTLAALRLAKERGARTLAIVNVVGSSIAREAERVLYTYAGPEIAVASTKAYSVQVAMFYLLALHISRLKGTLSAERLSACEKALLAIPQTVKAALETSPLCKKMAADLAEASDLFYIGRGLDYCLSMEGSLKLKEISYLHSEAYAAGELKHGTISLITEKVPVIAIVTQPGLQEKMVSNMQAVRARDGFVLAICQEDAVLPSDAADRVLRLPGPAIDPLFAPLAAIVPLQLIAYEIAVLRGCDVDKPRNLAKSVTVE